MEFLSLAAIVVSAGIASTLLAITGHSDAAATGAMLDVVKVGFGAIIALAYAARDTTPKQTISTSTTTSTPVTPVSKSVE